MESLIAEVNWLAVIVGAVVAFGVGALWYSSKLFGSAWLAGNRLTEEDVKGGSALPMFVQASATFLLAWVIGVTETTNDLAFAILIGLMVAAMIKANGLFAGKSKMAVAIESSYVVVMVIIMILAHAIL